MSTKARFKKFDYRLNPRRLVAGKSRSRFKHFFGGTIGAIAPKLARAPIHVLYSLDLRDPLLSFLGVEGKSLPLLFPMTVDGGSISYLATPEGGIKLLGKMPGPRAADWPRPDYPDAFPEMPVQVRELSYEQYRAALFRYQLGPADWLRKDDRALLKALGNSFTQLGGVQERPFGTPFDNDCPNPKCRSPGMNVFASVWNEPVPGVVLWDDGADVLIEFSMCRGCKAISAITMVD